MIEQKMSNLTFNQSLALSLYQSDEQFPINLDDAWQWLGYAEKRNCLDTLKNAFDEHEDFSRSRTKTLSGGRPRNCIMLSIDCFKMLGMMAGTEQGRTIRRYFLECERIAKTAIAERKSQSLSITQSRFNELITTEASLQQEIKDIEILLNKKRLELQEVSTALVNEAKACYDTNPGLIQQAIAVTKILDKAKANNRYLSV